MLLAGEQAKCELGKLDACTVMLNSHVAPQDVDLFAW